MLYRTIPAVLKESGVPPEDIVGVGTDFTACTALPFRKDGVPLCFLPEFAQNPHAYVKLWKHHAAQDKADRITALARLRGSLAAGLRRQGFLGMDVPKLWQLAEEAPELYGAMYRFVEAADWIVWHLTGNETCSACSRATKRSGTSVPAIRLGFFKALGPKNGACGGEAGKGDLPSWRKGGGRHRRNGSPYRPAGRDSGIRRQCGRPCVRAGCGDLRAGKLLAILGTSTCHMVLGTEGKRVPGVCGMVKRWHFARIFWI